MDVIFFQQHGQIINQKHLRVKSTQLNRRSMARPYKVALSFFSTFVNADAVPEEESK
jgi:hypothetical protein